MLGYVRLLRYSYGKKVSLEFGLTFFFRINFFTRESVSRLKQPLRLCMSNKILRSAKVKYHHSYLFFYKMNEGNLPLMYSVFFVFFLCVCEIIDLVGFFGCYCLTPVTFFIESYRGQTITAQKNRLDRCTHTRKHRNTSKVSLLYLVYIKISKNNDV